MTAARGGADTRDDRAAGRRPETDRRLLAVAAVVVAALAATAGCSAPESPAPPDAPAVATEGETISFDPGAEYARLRALLETNVSAPPSVTVLNESDVASGDATVTAPATFRAFGVVPEPERRGDLRYRYVAETALTGQVSVYPGEKPTPLVRTILVHEYVHYVQIRRDDDGRLRAAVPRRTTDGAFVYRSVLEGVAVTVTDAYVERFLPGAEPNSRLYRRIARVRPRGTPGWYGNAVYVFGARYVAERTDDPAAALAVAEDPPTTSEQVIHGYRPDEEPPRALAVTVDSEGSAWRPIGDDRLGEAFVRVALGDLPPDRAARAAAGWGTDELRVLRSPDATNASYVWVLRWDDPANATEFRRAYADSLSVRGERAPVGWRVDGRTATVERANETTTVVLVGPRAFVADTEVREEDGAVVVAPPDR